MSKIILNTSKKLELISNSGKLIFKAKMKTDYDAVNDIFGAREWVYVLMDISKKCNLNPQINGVNVFTKKTYMSKKSMLTDLSKLNCFSDALNELKK
jgi:hypothetical protein